MSGYTPPPILCRLAKQHPAVVAILKAIVAQEVVADARPQWDSIADALREHAPELAE